jgi:hypothetical protein
LIAGYSFTVWAHHMFTTGQINLYWFSIMSFIIAVPTGIKVFNWLATMWRGSIWLTTAMLMVVGFLVVFVIGGITGVFLASAPIDFQVNDTYYVVAHFHYVMVGVLLFGLFAGLYYWFPKMSGRLLSEAWGKLHFWSFFVGFNLTFFPQFLLGLSGMPRRIADSAASTAGHRSTSSPPWAPPSPACRSCPLSGTCSCRYARARSPATTPGKATAWNGRPPHPHPTTTSTTSPRSTPNDPCSTSATAWTTLRPATTPTHKPNPNAADHSRAPQAPVLVGHSHPVPGEHTAQHVRPTFWHHTFGTTADDIASESGGGGISGTPAVRNVSERRSPEGVAATRGRSVGWPRPRWPTLSTLQAQSVLSGLRG